MSPLMVPAPMRMAIAASTRTRPATAPDQFWPPKQAESTSQDRRARCSLNHASGDHHSAGGGERDHHTGGNEQQQTQLKDPFPPEDIANEAEVTVTAAPTNE
jgi:hypothetical protein